MNFLHATSSEENNILVNFNPDGSSLAVGTKNGFRLYDLKKIDKLELLYEDNTDYVHIVERLFSSSLVALVSLSSPRKITLLHYKQNNKIDSFSYANTILSVKLNRERVVVCLEESIFIHNIKGCVLLHQIKHIPRNPTGLFALSESSELCYLAYPAKNNAGEVNIFDAKKFENKLTIAAHDSPIVSMTFDPEGTKLATASDRGTVIRVFDTQNGNSLFEFRRGYARCVSIYSLSFSSDSMFLCASSNTETVHIFKLSETKQQEEDLTDMFKSCVKKVFESSYFTSVADMMNQWRSFATAKLPLCGPRTVCAIAHLTRKTPYVLIASTDGYLYLYDLNVVEGGDCTLIRQFRLIDEFGNHNNTVQNAEI